MFGAEPLAPELQNRVGSVAGLDSAFGRLELRINEFRVTVDLSQLVCLITRV